MSAEAGPADPTPFGVVQPDNSTFTARNVGDEHWHALETLDGFTILTDPATSFWVYAQRDATGALVPTTLVVGRDQPVGLTPHLRPAPSVLASTVMRLGPRASAVAAQPAPPVLGNRPLLVILAAFPDRWGTTAPSAWQSLLFDNTNSVADHYRASSYGAMNITPAAETHGIWNDGVVGWESLPTNHPNTGGTGNWVANEQLTADAILVADPYVNFAAYDTNGDGRVSPSELMIVVVVAGNETSFSPACSPSVWAHVGPISDVPAPIVDGVVAGADGYAQVGEMHCRTLSPPGQMATMGPVTHEIGHLLGLIDLYDRDGSSSGVGDWSLMGSGSWNSRFRSGDTPALLDAWSKYFLGWVSPTMVTTLITTTLAEATTSSQVFQVLAGSPQTGTGEYFLLENRQRTGYDAGIPGGGLLIWHIDEAKANNDAECVPGGTPACSSTVHYKVALMQSDGAYELERGYNNGSFINVFSQARAQSFSDISRVSSRLWNGAQSGVAITSIGPSGSIMFLTLSAQGPPPSGFSKGWSSLRLENIPLDTTLSWQTSDLAARYEYCLDTTDDNTCTTWTSVGLSTSVALTGLAPDTIYFWQVRAVNPGGIVYADGVGARMPSFSTIPSVPGAFGKYSPYNNSNHNSTDTLVFNWQNSAGAIAYEYCYDTTNDGACSPWTSVSTVSPSAVVLNAGLGPLTTYYWQVRAVGLAGTTYANGASSAFWSVTTLAEPDAFEEDDAPSTATLLQANAPPQLHTFDFFSDTDWSRISVIAGRQYVVSTSGLSALCDTTIQLYGPDGVTLLASDDNSGGGRASRLFFTASTTGTYFVRVQPTTTGVGAYSLSLATSAPLGPDFNGDGASDILWAHTDGRAALWLMNGASVAGGGGILGPGTGWSPVRLADLNGDGKIDVIWQHANGSSFGWLMNGAAVIGGVNLLDAGTGWSVRQTGDFSADGKQDILWRHADGSVAMWLMDGPNVVGGGGLIEAGSGWDAVQLGDFNGDGKQDIVWQHTDGRVAVWQMDGASVIGGGGLLDAATGWSVRQIGDFDGDRKSDILWTHTDGRAVLWLMNGANVTGGGGILGAGTGWSPAKVADFNGDGRSDIVWQHANGSISGWLMNGASVVGTGSLFGPGTGWTVSETGDYNKDGKQDILWRHTDGRVVMWLMNGLSQAGGGGLLDAATGWSPAP